MAYQKGERVTHLSARDRRTNGTIVGVHVDAGTEYFTVRLDDGREVQTIDDRLRKGEYTGIAGWQRMLDVRTGCYYFFDEERNETLWDTPEARERLFFLKRPSPTAVDDVVSPTRSRKSISPVKNVSFSTEPPSVVHFSTQEAEDEDEDDYVQLSPVAQPPVTVSSQPPLRTSFRSADLDSTISPTRKIPPQSTSSFSAPSLPEKPHHQPVVLSSEGSETRARNIANSAELRGALVKTGTSSIAGNLRVLGIPVTEEEYDSRKLADQLCWALAKISHSIDAGDLNLLLKHVMGGPENHSLADRLCFSGGSDRRSYQQPSAHQASSHFVGDEDDHIKASSNQLAYYNGPPQSLGQPPLRYDNLQPNQPTRQQFNDDDYREPQDYSNLSGQFAGHNAIYGKPRSPSTNYDNRSLEHQQQQQQYQETRRLSREGTGSMEMKGNVSPLAEPYLPITSPSNYERPEPNWQSDIRSDRASFGSRLYEASSPELSPAPVNSRYESRVQPLGTTPVSRHDLLGRANTSLSPNTPHGKPITGAMGSNESIKRRSELWANMPPPSRAPPSGPPSYDRYRQQQRPKSEDFRSTTNFDATKSYDSPMKQSSQSFNARSNAASSALPSAYYSAREIPSPTATTHTTTYSSSGRLYSSPASSSNQRSEIGRSSTHSWKDYGGDHLALPPLARDTGSSSKLPPKRQQEWEDDTKVRLYLGDDVNEDDSGSFKHEARHSHEGTDYQHQKQQLRGDDSRGKMNSSASLTSQQQQFGSSGSFKGEAEGETIMLSDESRLQQQQSSSDMDRQRNSRGELQNVRQASLRGLDTSGSIGVQDRNNQLPESSEMIEDAPQSILRQSSSRSGPPMRMNSDRGMENGRSSSPVRSTSPTRSGGATRPVEIDAGHDIDDAEQKDDHVIHDRHELEDEIRSSNEIDEGEHDVAQVMKNGEAIRADLSDLNMSLDKLLQQVAGAGDRIDATWKPQEEQIQIDPRPPPKPVKKVPVAKKQSTACGCIIS